MDALSSAKRLTQHLIIILTLAIISACSNQFTPKNYPPTLFSKLDSNANYFLKKADQASKQVSLQWQLIALQALNTENKPLMATSISEYLQTQTLTNKQQTALKVLIAENLYKKNQSNNALGLLNTLDTDKLSALGVNYFLKLKSHIYITNDDPLSATNTLLLLTPLTDSQEDKQQYNDLLFSQLILLPADILTPPKEEQPLIQDQTALTVDTPETNNQQADVVTPSDPIKQGWYALANLYQDYHLRPNQLMRSISLWKQHYPTHPAQAAMPTLLTNLPELSPYQPKNIAVLLPLSGRFKQQAEAIQSGLLNAYYGQQNKMDDQTDPVKLHFFDTQLDSIETITAQFKAQHIDFVIGPLLKSNVKKLLPLTKDMPVLTLNSFPKAQSTNDPQTAQETTLAEDDDNVATALGQPATEEVIEDKTAWHYAFPLSPEEEAKQAADFIFSQVHNKPLLIASDSTYGKRIAGAFNSEWEKLSQGQLPPVENYFFNDKAKFAQFIEGVLQTDQSKRRIDQMKLITQLPLDTEQRSRRDIDAIYIVSKRDELLMLKAFIDVSVSPFAKTIPLYASARSHLDDNHNKELSGLTFSDITLLLDKNSDTLENIQKTWKNQPFSNLRLFALGFDSYQLIGQLIELQNSKDYTYNGLIGKLSLNPDNTVRAKLKWAQYQQGKVIEITSPTTAE